MQAAHEQPISHSQTLAKCWQNNLLLEMENKSALPFLALISLLFVKVCRKGSCAAEAGEHHLEFSGFASAAWGHGVPIFAGINLTGRWCWLFCRYCSTHLTLRSPALLAEWLSVELGLCPPWKHQLESQPWGVTVPGLLPALSTTEALQHWAVGQSRGSHG